VLSPGRHVHVASGWTQLESDFVAPFYLSLMGQNAQSRSGEVWPELVDTGRLVTPGDLAALLRPGMWRPMVMGAWFALALPTEETRQLLVAAMRGSGGSLTAYPLATVCSIVVGADAVDSMSAYLDFISDPVRDDRSGGFVAAAIEHLGASPAVTPSDRNRQDLQEMVELASRLQDAFLRR
jgi:hypothetical protein